MSLLYSYSALENKISVYTLFEMCLCCTGSSQISRWTAFVLTIENNDIILWNPEMGDHYRLSDSRCSLMKVSLLINQSGVSMIKIMKILIVKYAIHFILNKIITSISYVAFHHHCIICFI